MNQIIIAFVSFVVLRELFNYVLGKTYVTSLLTETNNNLEKSIRSVGLITNELRIMSKAKS